jgi:hypothetical protein
MISRRTIAVLPSIVALLALMSNGVVAQDESASPAAAAGPVIAVTAQDYHFEGLPSSVPAGTSLTQTNAGHEVHELLVVRKNDGVTDSFDELLALPEEEALRAHMSYICGYPRSVTPATGTKVMNRWWAASTVRQWGWRGSAPAGEGGHVDPLDDAAGSDTIRDFIRAVSSEESVGWRRSWTACDDGCGGSCRPSRSCSWCSGSRTC